MMLCGANRLLHLSGVSMPGISILSGKIVARYLSIATMRVRLARRRAVQSDMV
jgi:hypothetical protein